MRKQNQSDSPGMFRIVAFTVAIAIIAMKTLRSVLNTLVRSYDGMQQSRHNTSRG